MCVVVPQRGPYSPPARRWSQNSMAMKRGTRSRVLPMKVFVTDAERTQIEERARIAGLSVSAYLRVAGLNQPIRSVLDHQAVCDLAKVNGDQGRLGGLLKLWLMERAGPGAPATEIRRLLDAIADIQAQLAEIAGRV